MTTTTRSSAWLLILIAASPAPHAAAFATDAGPREGKIDAIFLSLEAGSSRVTSREVRTGAVEAANSRVTYQEARTDAVKTSRVSSRTALEKLALLKQGQNLSSSTGSPTVRPKP